MYFEIEPLFRRMDGDDYFKFMVLVIYSLGRDPRENMASNNSYIVA
jgi:hypothetical protein